MLPKQGACVNRLCPSVASPILSANEFDHRIHQEFPGVTAPPESPTQPPIVIWRPRKTDRIGNGPQ